MSRFDLKTLSELANVVNKNKVKAVETLSNNKGDARIYDFYEKILSGTFENDTDASHYYFDSDKHHPQYRKLKGKLKEKLINTVFFIDVNSPKFNTHQRAFYTCQKQLMAIRILIGRYSRKPAIAIAESLLTQAIYYEFSDISYELLKILRSHFAVHSKRVSTYEKYRKLCAHYKTLVELEERAIEYYDQTSILIKRQTANHARLIELCLQCEEDLQPHLKEFSSYKLIQVYYAIAIRRLTLEKDNKELIRVSDEAIALLKGKGFVSEQFVGIYYYRKLTALVQVKEYEHAYKISETCLRIFEQGTVPWYNALILSFIFAMHSGDYQKALDIRSLVHESGSLKYQFQNRSETWVLHDAFLQYLALCNKISLSDDFSTNTFRINKFLNEVPAYSMDKSGSNIPILIIQILILIASDQRDKLTDKIEAIEKYTTRYLRRDDNFRSKCFIKMLLQLPKRHFNRTAVNRHTQKLKEKMTSMPLSEAKQSFEIEIIPYEILWEMVLESLERNK